MNVDSSQTVTDQMGRRVVVPLRPQRIISLVPCHPPRQSGCRSASPEPFLFVKKHRQAIMAAMSLPVFRHMKRRNQD
jgi:hypothetical protein